MFGLKERSPTPLRTNYDFTLRHERAKLFLKILTQCDAHAARTAQAVRDLVAAFSQVGQSYYEVSLCVNNVNPSTASILQARRAPADGDEPVGEDDPAQEFSTPAGGRSGRNFEKRADLMVARRGREVDISYHDGVVAEYGAGLQTAAKVFASETRSLKEGKRFAEYSEGVHSGVLARLKEVETAAKQTVESGYETERLLQRFIQAKKLVALKEKKYARLGRPLSESKKYETQVATMQRAEELYIAKLASFDEKFEHLFQRDLYVTGHTLDSFLDVNFIFMAHLMQAVGSLAPSAQQTLEKVLVEGGDALGKRMGIAEENRIGSRIKAGRGLTAATTSAAAVDAKKVTDESAKPSNAGGAARKDPKTSHNFTNYFSTRREVRRPAVIPKQLRGDGSTDSVVAVDEAPPTAKNNDEATMIRGERKLVRAPTKTSDLGTPAATPIKQPGTPPPPPTPEVATAKPSPAKPSPAKPSPSKPAKAPIADDEPEPRPPTQPQPSQQPNARQTPDRVVAKRNMAHRGDGPSAAAAATKAPPLHLRQGQQQQQQQQRRLAATAGTAATATPVTATAVASAEGVAAESSKPLVAATRNPSHSPSCDPPTRKRPYTGFRRASSTSTPAWGHAQLRRSNSDSACGNHGRREGNLNVSRRVFDSAEATPGTPVSTRGTSPVVRAPAKAAPTPVVAKAPLLGRRSRSNCVTTPRVAVAGSRATAASSSAPAPNAPVENYLRANQLQQRQQQQQRKPTAAAPSNGTRKRPVITSPAPGPCAAATSTPAVAATSVPVVSAPPAEDTDTDADSLSGSLGMNHACAETSARSNSFGNGHNAQQRPHVVRAAAYGAGVTPVSRSSGTATTSGSVDANPVAYYTYAYAGNAGGSGGAVARSLSTSMTLSQSGLCASPGNDAATGGRPTVAAVPGAALKGLPNGNGSFTSYGAGNGFDTDDAPLNGNSILCEDMTPQMNNVSGASTPQPLAETQRQQQRHTDPREAPFYTAAWEEVNLSKGVGH